MSSFIQAKAKEGSLLGGSLLVSGSCIGAGMLALPIMTGASGFLPSLCMFFLAWAFMAASGQLLLAVNLKLGYQCSLISLAEQTLGRVGRLVCWVLFLFLFYALNVAYVSALGPIGQAIVASICGVAISPWACSLGFVVVFAGVIFAGIRPVDLCNRVLMVGLIIAYVLLVSLGSSYIQPKLLMHSEWRYAASALPILVISFGFHNMIPSLAMYLQGDERRLRTIIWVGSFAPLVVYLIWQVAMLGMLPQEEIRHALLHGEAATVALQSAVGRGWVATIGNLFALFAIVTSLLAQSLSLVDFLADGLKVSKQGLSRVGLIALTLVPPTVCALLNPGLFIHALTLAGGLAAVVLFGILPACMIYRLDARLVPGWIVKGVFVFALLLFVLQVLDECGLSLLPRVIA